MIIKRKAMFPSYIFLFSSITSSTALFIDRPFDTAFDTLFHYVHEFGDTICEQHGLKRTSTTNTPWSLSHDAARFVTGTESATKSHHGATFSTVVSASAISSNQLMSKEAYHSCGVSLSAFSECIAIGHRERTLNILSSTEACEFSNHFSRVMLHGNSFGRHITIALFNLLSGNLRTGSFSMISKGEDVENPNKVYSTCQCDGQFYEEDTCRVELYLKSFQRDYLYIKDTRQYSICPALALSPPSGTPDHFGISYSYLADNLTYPLTCREDDSRPLLLYVNAMELRNGGSHDASFDAWLRPAFQFLNNEILQAAKRCGSGKTAPFIIIVSGGNSPHPKLANKYPTQTRTMQQEHTAALRKRLSADSRIVFVDFINLTLDGDTVDGGHYLLSVNLQKVNVILQAAMLALREPDRYLVDGPLDLTLFG